LEDSWNQEGISRKSLNPPIMISGKPGNDGEFVTVSVSTTDPGVFSPAVSEAWSPSMSEFLEGLESSGWLKHIKAVLDAGIFIAKVSLSG
jgi:hypothetical protein